MSKYAVLIGINYISTPYRLYGCINDAIMMRKYLIEKRGYTSTNITMLRDDINTFVQPTKENIINQLNNLINTANINNASEIMFHYSGHGSQIKDLNGDERDGKDEVIYPVDLKYISDDELRNVIKKLNNNTKLYCVIDSCNSGTSFDLPYLFDQNNNKLFMKENNSTKYSELLNKKIYFISGCQDEQSSADLYSVYQLYQDINPNYSITNKSGGALSSTVIKTNFEFNGPFLSFIQNQLRWLTQRPLLSSSSDLTYVPPKPQAKPAKKPIRIVNIKKNRISKINKINRLRKSMKIIRIKKL